MTEDERMHEAKTQETGKERTRIGVAHYLEQFDRLPYSYPACDYRSVEGVSTLKGSWFQERRTTGKA